MHVLFVTNKPKKVENDFQDESWINTMYEGLNQIIRNDVWKLVPHPNSHDIIGTKWIFKNKSNEFGIIIINKAMMTRQVMLKIKKQLKGVLYWQKLCDKMSMKHNSFLLSTIEAKYIILESCHT